MRSTLIRLCLLGWLFGGTAWAAPSWSLSYFGESLVHPGFCLGLDYPLKTARAEPGWSLAAGPQLGLVIHPHHSTTPFIGGRLVSSLTFSGGLNVDLVLGLSGLRTLLASPTYQVTGAGAVERVPLAGQAGIMPALGLGLGHRPDRWVDRGAAWHLRPTLYLQLPYNASFAPFLALEAGISWKRGTR